MFCNVKRGLLPCCLPSFRLHFAVFHNIAILLNCRIILFSVVKLVHLHALYLYFSRLESYAFALNVCSMHDALVVRLAAA